MILVDGSSTNSDKPGNRNREIDFLPLQSLKSHERTIEARLEEVTNQIRGTGRVDLPILIDANTEVILDGHHRYEALKNLGAKTVPVLKVNYLDEDGIALAPGPNCPVESLTREKVIETGQSDSRFPPKSTRHRVTFPYPPVNAELNGLQKP